MIGVCSQSKRFKKSELRLSFRTRPKKTGKAELRTHNHQCRADMQIMEERVKAATHSLGRSVKCKLPRLGWIKRSGLWSVSDNSVSTCAEKRHARAATCPENGCL